MKKKELNKIIKQTTSLLKEQIDSSNKGSSYWKERFGSEFVLGYIFGYSIMLIGSKIKDEKEKMFGVQKVFDKLFGKRFSIRILATAKFHSNSLDFKDGQEVARNDLIKFIDEDGDRPASLSKYLKE